jgi:lysophospholipase L1-like esterase
MKTVKKLILLVLVFCFILCACDNGLVSDESALIPASVSVQWWEDRHNELSNHVIPNQKIILIGDSLTHGWEGTAPWTELKVKYADKITNLGFAADKTQHVIWRLQNGEFPVGINPEYVVLLIGSNNTQNRPQAIAAGIEKIITIINQNAPVTHIILVSLLPRGSGNYGKETRRIYEVT